MASAALSQFNLDLSDVSVLDAFAGTGALGIEMLSRGARSVTFFERDAGQLRLLKANLSLLKKDGPEAENDCIYVHIGDAAILSGKDDLPGAPFKLVLLDPPYKFDPQLSESVLLNLTRAGHISSGCITIHEREGKRESLSSRSLEGWTFIKEKRIGTIAFEILRWSGSTIK